VLWHIQSENYSAFAKKRFKIADTSINTQQVDCLFLRLSIKYATDTIIAEAIIATITSFPRHLQSHFYK